MTDPKPDPRVTLLVTGDGMGAGPAELGRRLIQTYLGLLELEDRLPGTICFYTEGVKLVLEDSPVLEELRSLADRGVRLVVCGTCVQYFDVADRIGVGEVGSMKDIIAAQWDAAKVITV